MHLKKIVYLGPEYGFNHLEKIVCESTDYFIIQSNKANFFENGLDAHAIIDASMDIVFGDDIIEKMSNLRLISCATTGSSHIQFNRDLYLKVQVRTLRENLDVLWNLTPAAELSWALLLACARDLVQATSHVKSGGWDRTIYPGKMINGKTLGIIGYGRIGQWMGRYARAFGMKVIAYDPHVKTGDVEFKTLTDIFKESDIITIHVHLNNDTHGFINADLLALAKKGLILINTSRGEVLQEQDVVDAIKNGTIESVGLDVLCFEPQVEKSLLYKYSLENPKIIVTPHFGGYCPEAVLKVIVVALNKVIS